jgi:phosphatidate cytidylyltransferase
VDSAEAQRAPPAQGAPPQRHPNGLTLRILSALVLAPLALAAVWFGAPFLPALVALAGAGMGWEWARLSRVRAPVAVTLVIAAPFLAACAIAFDRDLAAWLVALLFALAAALAERGLRARLWTLVGTLWIALPCMAVLWLERSAGRGAIFFLLAVVWASDIGAFAFGRVLGGPKLAPRLSPNKTWAGSLGGLLCAILVGIATAAILHGAAARLIASSFIVAVAAELGDLAESFAKRRFGVKDSSKLIPGHGGLLDRLDSLLAAAIALALLLAAAGPIGLDAGP